MTVATYQPLKLIPSRALIIENVIAQLPIAIRANFVVQLTNDAYMIRVTAELVEKSRPDRRWITELIPGKLPDYGDHCACRLPDEFLARLCALT